MTVLNSDLCHEAHTYTHKHTLMSTPPFANRNSQSGTACNLLTQSRKEEICQLVLKMSFYSNHLNNRYLNEKD